MVEVGVVGLGDDYSTMYQSFEQLEVWQQAIELAHRVRQVAESRAFKGDNDIKRQMRRAAVSIPSNIAEGYEKGSARDSIKFYRIAKGSAGELRTQLVLCKMAGDLPDAVIDELMARSLSVSRSLGGFIRNLQDRVDQTTRPNENGLA